MCAMAIPMVLLFEGAVVFAVVHDRRKARRKAERAAERPAHPTTRCRRTSDPIPRAVGAGEPVGRRRPVPARRIALVDQPSVGRGAGGHALAEPVCAAARRRRRSGTCAAAPRPQETRRGRRTAGRRATPWWCSAATASCTSPRRRSPSATRRSGIVAGGTGNDGADPRLPPAIRSPARTPSLDGRSGRRVDAVSTSGGSIGAAQWWVTVLCAGLDSAINERANGCAGRAVPAATTSRSRWSSSRFAARPFEIGTRRPTYIGPGDARRGRQQARSTAGASGSRHGAALDDGRVHRHTSSRRCPALTLRPAGADSCRAAGTSATRPSPSTRSTNG